MKNYHDMSAVITGGASGLGLATAKRLRKAGVKVAIFDMNAAVSYTHLTLPTILLV